MPRDFQTWLSKFRKSISTYQYYVDFEKVHRNVNGVKFELNLLNSLIASEDIENEFDRLIDAYPAVLKCIPLLLAVRANKIYAIDFEGEREFNFCKKNYTNSEYKTFMRKTGLFDLLQNHMINNLVDYVTGVETGLDSNGRKNRGGHLMEDLVESYIQAGGFVKDQDYYKEMCLKDIQKRWHVDMSALSNNGRADKRFDFVVRTPSMIYGIETNFYTGIGSKLNETARSYKQIAQEAEQVEGFTFVWFTDGTGWLKARNNLEETFDAMEHLYSIDDMENGVMGRLFGHAPAVTV